MKPVLQVALDLIHLKRALDIGKDAVEGGADWVEAGTPLIKSEGVEAIRALKKSFPQHVIVADLKTMDVGGFEIEIATKAGADVISVLALADDSTIKESVAVARKYGAKIMVDLIGVQNKVQRAVEVEAFGASYVCLHVGVDEQMKGGASSLDILSDLVSSIRIPVAVAGGITSETIFPLIQSGASIIIVGGSIIKAKNVVEATKKVKRAIEGGAALPSEVSKKFGSEELMKAFSKVSTPNIADAQHKLGVMKDIHPRIAHGMKMVGKALTVQTTKGDWAKPVEAIDRAEPGDVIVIDAGGSDIAVFGELAAWSCKTKGVSGVVIDGAVRDIEEIINISFPVFSKFVVPHAGEPKGFGGIGIEINCGGQQVRSGDWIIGDENGVIVVPQESAVEIANRALDISERENRIREEIKGGGTLSSVQELEKWEQIR